MPAALALAQRPGTSGECGASVPPWARSWRQETQPLFPAAHGKPFSWTRAAPSPSPTPPRSGSTPADYQPELVAATHVLASVHITTKIYNHQLCVLDERLWPFAVRSISDWKNDYLDVCRGWSVRDACGGVFTTSGSRVSGHLRDRGDGGIRAVLRLSQQRQAAIRHYRCANIQNETRYRPPPSWRLRERSMTVRPMSSREGSGSAAGRHFDAAPFGTGSGSSLPVGDCRAGRSL
jgi:hypothetical protein